MIVPILSITLACLQFEAALCHQMQDALFPQTVHFASLSMNAKHKPADIFSVAPAECTLSKTVST